MRTIQLCLAMNETDYGMSLARSLIQISRFFYIGDQPMESYDLILTDDLSMSADKMVFFTDEQADEIVDINRKIFIIYKYQHAGQISKILNLAHSLFSETELISEHCEAATIISVCASAGGVGCTSIAMGLCLELAKFQGQRVLYLCLEEFESTTMFFPGAGMETPNIVGYLYRLLKGSQDKNPSVTGYLLQNEFAVFAFRPSPGRNPLRELNESDFIKFINAVLGEGIFSHVIVDCSNGMDEAISAAMKLSSKVCHVAADSVYHLRMQSYLQNALFRAGDAVKDDWIFVNNFPKYTYDNWDLTPDNAEETDIMIPFDSSSFKNIDGRMMIMTDKLFGRSIQNLLASIRYSNG